LKSTWGHVKNYNKIKYFWTFEYVVFFASQTYQNPNSFCSGNFTTFFKNNHHFEHGRTGSKKNLRGKRFYKGHRHIPENASHHFKKPQFHSIPYFL
jgi:hypothetical protein